MMKEFVLSVTLAAAFAFSASEPMSLANKLRNRNVSDLQIEKKVQALSSDSRATILESRELGRALREERARGRMETMQEDRSIKNREDRFRVEEKPRSFLAAPEI